MRTTGGDDDDTIILHSTTHNERQTKKTVKDLTRARQTVQHAHRYFSQALRICDEVRGSSLSRKTVGLFGGNFGVMGKITDYQGLCFLWSRRF